MDKGWLLLLIAGCTEIVFASTLKLSEGFTRLVPTVLTVISGIVSFTCLSQAIRTIPVGTAYAVWCGIGIVGIAVVGMVFFKEPADWLRLLCIAAILAGIVGLKLA